MKKMTACVGLTTALMAVTAACSSGSDVAADGKGKNLHVAVLLAGTNSSWDQAVKTGIETQAKKKGVTITVFDAGYDPAKQFSQLQSAEASGRYNAYSVLSISPGQMCPAVQRLGKKNIPVIIMDQPTCVDPTADIADLHAKDTLSFGGGDTTLAQAKIWTDEIVKDNPGKQKMLMLMGTPSSSFNTVIKAAMEQSLKDASSQMEVIFADTDFTRASGLEKAQALLQSNKDITIVGGPSDPSAGAVSALERGGLSNIKRYVTGGDDAALKAMQEGAINMVQVARPRTIGVATANQWAAYQTAGKAQPVIFTPDVQPGKSPAALLTRENVGSFHAEF